MSGIASGPRVTIGTAGWSIPAPASADFPLAGTHLRRYSHRFRGVEINSTFYRRHRPNTFVSWASQVPDDFRFAVKLPRTITHEHALRDAASLLDAFFDDVAGLGLKLGPVLMQLPPSLAYEHRVATRFLADVRERFAGVLVCEPRHPSWASRAASDSLIAAHVGRVAAHPPRLGDSERPGGWLGRGGDGAGATAYYRLHGSPHTYWSSYPDAALAQIASELAAWPSRSDVWCIFDNTAAGAATANAMFLVREVWQYATSERLTR